MRNLNLALGQWVLYFLEFLGGVTNLVRDSFRELRRPPLYPKLIIEQIYHVGIRSLPLVMITAVSTGMVMALQFGLGLEKFGGKLYVPKIVSLSIVREMGPVFCSLMLAARIGAGFASEIGSMVVTQQIDAIRALGTSPLKKIVIPRIIGCLIAIPLLCAMSDVVGIWGGLLIGHHELGLDPNFYYEKVIQTITITDYLSGVGKTFVFAFFIAIVSCYFGMTVRGGTRSVGIATTNAVVVSSVSILISDFFLTKLIFILFEQ